jgi:predicted AAA+ superfamily ATPase
MELIPRHLAAKVARTLKTSRVINIVGPRQTGKTTLVRDILNAGRFLTLDDEGLLSSLALDPFGQLAAVAAKERVRDGSRMAETPLYRRLGA